MEQHVGVLALLSDEERAILHEYDELTLDFTSLSKDGLVVVAPQCVVIGYGELCDEFLAMCINDEHTPKLELLHLLPQDFVSLKGHLGAFELTFKNANGRVESLSTAQVVSFSPLQNLRAFKGVHLPSNYSSAREMLDSILSLCGDYEYTRNIIFDPTHCQFQSRRPFADGSSVCHACADICPTLGISSDKALSILELSAIDCIACGRCVSVCPTGSVQREGDGLEAFSYKSRLYKGYIPLIVSKQAFSTDEFAQDFKALRAQNALFLPFVMPVPDMLNSTYLLTLLQESGAPIVLYTPLGEHTHKDIESINDIYHRIFGKKAIYTYADSIICAGDIAPIAQTHYIYTPTSAETSKDIFSERMRFWVKQEDYGKVGINGFGILGINAQKCTLCLSCVEACNTQALISNQTRFELLYKPSLCTDCGYCVASCAENVLSIESSSLNLTQESFEYTQIAQDEPFRCVECDKIFATRRSIEKIKQILAPAFGKNPLKLKTLECCADCKVKVMFEEARS